MNQAKQTQKAATKGRDDRLKVVLGEALKAELAVKSHYGPKSPKTARKPKEA